MSRNRDVGREWEKRVADYLRSRGGIFARAKRRDSINSPDGDIEGLEGIAVVEAKGGAQHKWTEWFSQLEKEEARTGDPGVLVVKRYQKNVKDALAVMTLERWAMWMERMHKVIDVAVTKIDDEDALGEILSHVRELHAVICGD